MFLDRWCVPGHSVSSQEQLGQVALPEQEEIGEDKSVQDSGCSTQTCFDFIEVVITKDTKCLQPPLWAVLLLDNSKHTIPCHSTPPPGHRTVSRQGKHARLDLGTESKRSQTRSIKSYKMGERVR